MPRPAKTQAQDPGSLRPLHLPVLPTKNKWGVRRPPPARLETLSHPVCGVPEIQGRARAPQPLPRHHPQPRPRPGDSACREGAGLLLCGLGERGPALAGDPAGNEHLHDSHRPHSPGSRRTLPRTARRKRDATGGGAGPRRGGAGAGRAGEPKAAGAGKERSGGRAVERGKDKGGVAGRGEGACGPRGAGTVCVQGVAVTV